MIFNRTLTIINHEESIIKSLIVCKMVKTNLNSNKFPFESIVSIMAGCDYDYVTRIWHITLLLCIAWNGYVSKNIKSSIKIIFLIERDIPIIYDQLEVYYFHRSSRFLLFRLDQRDQR